MSSSQSVSQQQVTIIVTTFRHGYTIITAVLMTPEQTFTRNWLLLARLQEIYRFNYNRKQIFNRFGF